MAAAAWLRQRGLGNPVLGAEPGMNPFAAAEMSAFANALAKLPVQVCIVTCRVLHDANRKDWRSLLHALGKFTIKFEIQLAQHPNPLATSLDPILLSDQGQQHQAAPVTIPPHVSQLMHLQQLAQSLGSSTAVPPWQLPLSQSQPPANYPVPQQWKEAMLMQAAKAGNPVGPAKVSLLLCSCSKCQHSKITSLGFSPKLPEHLLCFSVSVCLHR